MKTEYMMQSVIEELFSCAKRIGNIWRIYYNFTISNKTHI